MAVVQATCARRSAQVMGTTGQAPVTSSLHMRVEQYAKCSQVPTIAAREEVDWAVWLHFQEQTPATFTLYMSMKPV